MSKIRVIKLPRGKEFFQERDLLLEFLNRAKRSFLFAGFLSFFINLLMLLPSIYMLAVYDIVVPSRSVSSLIFITAIIVFLYLIWGLLQGIRSRIFVRVNNKLDAFYNEKVVNANFKFALKYPTRASIQPIQDFQQIKQFLTGPTVFAFFDIPWVPIYLFVMFVFHPYYGFWAIGVMCLVSFITFLNEITTKKKLKEANELQIKSNKFMTHVIQNVEVIEAMGMRKNIYKKWQEVYKKYMVALQKASDMGGFWTNTSRTFRVMCQSLMYGVGGYLAIHLKITGGMIVAGAILLGRVLSPIDLLLSTWRQFSSARLSYKRLKELLNEFEEEEKELVQLPEPKGRLTLAHVVVIPPMGKEPVLKNITMNINPGELVAVIGPSGAGKTSLVKTMLGIWLPASGEVLIDGADIRQWDKERLGKFIGYLPQDIELFEGTVAENIARFEKVDSEKVIAAAMLAGAHELILSFPEGYNTYIGPGGMTLSGGQRQRVALARALYGNPKIVVLDEPNSNLDEAGERALLQALIELKKRRITTIVISHKLNILSLADKIAILQNGVLTAFDQASKILQALRASAQSAARKVN